MIGNGLDKHLVSNLRRYLWLAGADNVRHTVGPVRVGGELLLQVSGEIYLRGIDMGDRERADRAIVIAHGNGAPIGNLRHHKVG